MYGNQKVAGSSPAVVTSFYPPWPVNLTPIHSSIDVYHWMLDLHRPDLTRNMPRPCSSLFCIHVVYMSLSVVTHFLVLIPLWSTFPPNHSSLQNHSRMVKLFNYLDFQISCIDCLHSHRPTRVRIFYKPGSCFKSVHWWAGSFPPSLFFFSFLCAGRLP